MYQFVLCVRLVDEKYLPNISLNIRRLGLTEKLSSKISWQNININLKLFELSVEKLSLGQIHKQYQSVLNVRLVGRKYVSNNRVSFILGDLSFQKYKPLHTIYFCWFVVGFFDNIKGQKYKLFLNWFVSAKQ